MKVLYLERNDLSGTIPTEFGSLNWKRLHLDGNVFQGKIPPDINSPDMEELHLHDNKFTGAFPVLSFTDDFSGVSKLREITMYNNHITGDVNKMRNLFYDAKLAILEVDLEKVSCQCCSGAP